MSEWTHVHHGGTRQPSPGSGGGEPGEVVSESLWSSASIRERAALVDHTFSTPQLPAAPDSPPSPGACLDSAALLQHQLEGRCGSRGRGQPEAHPACCTRTLEAAERHVPSQAATAPGRAAARP